MSPLAVGHAYPQAQPIVNIGVDQAAGGLRQARQAVFIIVSVGVGLTHTAQADQVPVGIVGVAFVEGRRNLVMGVVGERLHQVAAGGQGQAVGVVVVGVALGGRRGCSGAGFAGEPVFLLVVAIVI